MTDHPPLPGDDLPDHLVELASRYIDGDVDAVERAEVEADPRLMELAARFADLRTQLQRPSTVGAEHREDAITAALAAFDSLDSEAPAAPVVRSLDAARAARQRRMTRWLGAAAAVAAVAIAGGALTSTIGSDDTDDSSSETMIESHAADTTTVDNQLTLSDAESADEESAASSEADSSAAGAATAAPAEAPTASTAATSDTTVAGAAETTSEAGDTATTRSAETVELANEDAVREYVAREEKTPTPTSAPCSQVATGDLSGEPVTYQGKPAVIYVENNTALVYNSETCVVLATVTLT